MLIRMASGPETVEWNEAPGFIAAMLDGPRPVVGITGPAGAGKSTLARLVAGRTGGLVISTDNYLPDYEGLPVEQRDLPEHADLPLLAEHLRLLRAGSSAEVPVWSFHEHRRTGSRRVGPASGPIVCEGLFALHGSLGGAVDVRVFVDAPPAVRRARWEEIERRGERGMGVKAALRFFDEVADPTYARFAPGYRGAADVLVKNGG